MRAHSAVLALAVALAVPAVHATVWDTAALSAIPPSTVGMANYFADDGSELVLTVIQDRTGDGSMGGAPGQGLWLGQAGEGSRYLVLFNLPVPRVTISFAGLTASGAQVERLIAIEAFGSIDTTVAFDSPDGSTAYVGGEVFALGADGSGQLTFTPPPLTSLSGITFTHDQPAALGGLFITRVEVSPVPEPSSTAAWLLGMAAVALAVRRQRARSSRRG